MMAPAGERALDVLPADYDIQLRLHLLPEVELPATTPSPVQESSGTRIERTLYRGRCLYGIICASDVAEGLGVDHRPVAAVLRRLRELDYVQRLPKRGRYHPYGWAPAGKLHG